MREAKKRAAGREQVLSVGVRGINRVSVIRRRGVLWLEWNEVTELGKRDRQLARCEATTIEQAKREALVVAERLRTTPRPSITRRRSATNPGGAVTLDQLIGEYRRGLFATFSADERRYAGNVLSMLARLIGPGTRAITIGETEWRQYVTARTTSAVMPDLRLFPELKDGRLVARGALRFMQFEAADGTIAERVVPPALLTDRQCSPDRPRGWRWPTPVDKRAIQREFRVLRRFFAWATTRVRDDGTTWLPAGHGFLKIAGPPKPAKRKRQPMSQSLYTALRSVASQVSDDLPDLLELLDETGRRVGSVLNLEFADADHAAGTLRWRRVFDKTSEETVVQASARALATIRARAERRGVTLDAPQPVFERAVRPLRLPPPPKQRSAKRWARWEARCAFLRTVHQRRTEHARGQRLLARTALDWLDKAFKLAKLTRPEDRFAFHALRRKFAVDMRRAGVADPVTREIGGWRDEKTFNDAYADVTPDMQREALNRRPTRVGREVG